MDQVAVSETLENIDELSEEQLDVLEREIAKPRFSPQSTLLLA